MCLLLLLIIEFLTMCKEPSLSPYTYCPRCPAPWNCPIVWSCLMVLNAHAWFETHEAVTRAVVWQLLKEWGIPPQLWRWPWLAVFKGISRWCFDLAFQYSPNKTFYVSILVDCLNVAGHCGEGCGRWCLPILSFWLHKSCSCPLPVLLFYQIGCLI